METNSFRCANTEISEAQCKAALTRRCVIQKNSGTGSLGNIINYKMILDFWALLFYSVKSFELVIICGFVKIEEDQLLCIRGEERHERKTLL